MTIDFDQFHPLDHTLAQCRGYPGGWRRHLGYRWEFQWREQLVVWMHHIIGHHVWYGLVRARDNEPVYIVRCRGRNCTADPDPFTTAKVIGNMRNDRELQMIISVLPAWQDTIVMNLDEEEDVGEEEQ